VRGTTLIKFCEPERLMVLIMPMKIERLDKILANMGYGTRKEVKLLVRTGVVKIDGEVVKKSDIKVKPDAAIITVNDKQVVYKEFIYLMLNKPQGYISATNDKMHPTVIDLVPDEFVHYETFPVGRLDIDTEGLLLLTNDGNLAHNLLSPKKHVPKTYFAQVLYEVSDDDITAFEQGIILDDDYKTLPAKLQKADDGYLVTIYEGKFHQIKRMFEGVGNKVTYLKRIKMGGLPLDEALELGEMREITKEEMDKLWI